MSFLVDIDVVIASSIKEIKIEIDQKYMPQLFLNSFCRSFSLIAFVKTMFMRTRVVKRPKLLHRQGRLNYPQVFFMLTRLPLLS